VSLLEKLKGKFRWHANEFLGARPGLAAALGRTFTVVDAFGTPGDTIQTATVCRNLKRKFPQLRINCVTPNPGLLKHDPNIAEFNGPQRVPTVKFWYLNLIDEKNGTTHLLQPTMHQIGLHGYDGRAEFHLSAEERSAAEARCAELIGRPFLTINVQSREQVKTWFTANWQRLVEMIAAEFPELAIVQLGADDEPQLNGVIRLAGKLKIRDSVALQARAQLHIGCVSFLMHTANGVGVRSVIIYGGRETPANSGYADNENLYVKLPCSPCWLHNSRGDVCPHDMKCMHEITPEQVFTSVKKILLHRQNAPTANAVAA
jgi:ADP-heptose:LPS heptosyltransferase